MSEPAAGATTAADIPNGTTPEKAKLHHVGITVTLDDFDPMIEWYRNVLDFEINYRGTRGAMQVCFLVNDEANHRLVFIADPKLAPEPTGPHAGLGHTAYEFPTLDGLLAKYATLRDQGIYPFQTIDHGPTFSIYYMDPNNYGVELQADAFGDWAKSTEFMHTSEQFNENLSGVLFDPEALIQARKDGKSLEEIHEATYVHGAYPPTARQRQRLAVRGVGLRGQWDHPSWGDDHPTFAGIDG